MKISKEKIKSYLESASAENMMKQLKERIDNQDAFGDFKSEFTTLIQKYINNPTGANKKALDTLISRNYTEGNLFARESLEHILSELGFRPEIVESRASKGEEESKGPKRDLEEIRKIYEDLGIEYPGDTLKRVLASLEEVDSNPDRKKRKIEKPQGKNQSKVKREGKIKKTIGMRLVHLKNSIAEKRQKAQFQEMEDALSEIEILKKNLLTGKTGILAEILPKDFENMPESIKSSYEQFDAMGEKELVAFKTEISKSLKKRLSEVRKTLKIMERTKLEEKLRKLAEDNSDIPREEIEDEVEDVIEYTNVDEEGEIILPKHSPFQKVFLDEEGNIREEHSELAQQISDYILRFEELELSDKVLAELMGNLRNPENAAILPENVEEFEKAYQEYVTLKKMARLVDITHKLTVLTEIGDQIQEIHTVVKGYQEKQKTEELEKDEERKRKIALRIAKKKVRTLEKANLSELIAEGMSEMDKILKGAKHILLPELEKARNTGEKKWEREFLEEQEDEEREEK